MSQNTPDLIVNNAVIWNGETLTEHTAVAVTAGKITALGGAEVAQLAGANTQVVDAAGGLLTPGFVDCHNHTAMGGIERNSCDLTGCENSEQAIAAVAAYAAANPEAEWILGGGWRIPWFEGGTPLKEQLDAVVPDRPVYLLNADHHAAWANSKALELAGITADTADPSDGRIERDATGNPNGTLQEGATALVASVLPEYTPAVIRAGILAGEKYLFECGVTAWQEAILGDYGGYPDFSPVYAEMADAAELTGRVTGALWVSRDFDGMTIPEYVADLTNRRAKYARAGFNLDHIKIMADGVQENGTAALTDPYVSDCNCAPANTGLAYFSRDSLLELIPLLNEAEFDVHVHAIGDRAVKYALDAFEAVPAAVREARHNHIAHLHVVDPVDLPRFAELGIRANIQALWACQDQQMLDVTFPTLGETRIPWQYPFAGIARHGATLVCGSDWPVSTPDPWQAVHVAVTRTQPGAEPGEPLLPEQALTLEQMLTAYHRNSAQLLRTGSGLVQVGEAADFAIADRNPFAAPMSELWQTTNKLTVVAGKVVFNAAA